MAIIREAEDNKFYKQPSELEAYLLRIIDRYFNVNQEYTNIQIESIVQESFTRLKRWLNRHKGFIFSLNRRGGHLELDMEFFGGENEIIEKGTAFNKDFGKIEDTVCEGNDPRLSDKREPLEHTHYHTDIEGIEDAVNSIVANIDSVITDHYHSNQRVLNLLRYTGIQSSIDLVVLDGIKDKINNISKQLDYYSSTQAKDFVERVETIQRYIADIQSLITRANNMDIDSLVNWLNKAKEYTDDKFKEKIESLLSASNKIIPSNYPELVRDNFNSADRLVHQNSFTLNMPASSLSVSRYYFSVPDHKKKAKKNFFMNMYNKGVRSSNWTYNIESQSLSCIYEMSDTDPLYNYIYSCEKYDEYTMRVFISSNDIGNGSLGICLAYNDITREDITLVINPGGIADTLLLQEEFNLIRTNTADSDEPITNKKQIAVSKDSTYTFVKSIDNNGDGTIDSTEYRYEINPEPQHIMLARNYGKALNLTTDYRIITAEINDGDDSYTPAPVYITTGDHLTNDYAWSKSKYLQGDDCGLNMIGDGVGILIKRQRNEFLIWYTFSDGSGRNGSEDWFTVERYNNDNEIYPATSPDIRLSLEDVDGMGSFIDHANKVGFVSFNQTGISIVNFHMYGLDSSSSQDYTDLGFHNIKTETVSNKLKECFDENTNSTRLKTYIEYTNTNGMRIKAPLPYHVVTNDGKQYDVYAKYNENGKIEVNTNFYYRIPVKLTSPLEVYMLADNSMYIPVYSLINNSVADTKEMLTKYNCNIAVMKEREHNELEEELRDDTVGDYAQYKERRYIVQGQVKKDSHNVLRIMDDDGNPLPYYEARIPNTTYAANEGNFVYIQYDPAKSQNMQLTDSHSSYDIGDGTIIDDVVDDFGFILHYSDKRPEEYFTDAVISYQIFTGPQVQQTDNRITVSGTITDLDTGEIVDDTNESTLIEVLYNGEIVKQYACANGIYSIKLDRSKAYTFRLSHKGYITIDYSVTTEESNSVSNFTIEKYEYPPNSIDFDIVYAHPDPDDSNYGKLHGGTEEVTIALTVRDEFGNILNNNKLDFDVLDTGSAVSIAQNSTNKNIFVVQYNQSGYFPVTIKASKKSDPSLFVTNTVITKIKLETSAAAFVGETLDTGWIPSNLVSGVYINSYAFSLQITNAHSNNHTGDLSDSIVIYGKKTDGTEVILRELRENLRSDEHTFSSSFTVSDDIRQIRFTASTPNHAHCASTAVVSIDVGTEYSQALYETDRE